jgi:uncharacterized membrane protein
MNTVDEIAKLKGLLDDGAISQEEYDSMKANLLEGGDAPGGDASANSAPASGGEQYGQQQSQQGGQWQAPNQQSGQWQTPPPNQGSAGARGHMAGTPYANYEEDVAANKVFGILAYIGFLCFISAFAAPKESHYARFHANQGLVLFVFELAGGIILGIAWGVVAASSLASLYAWDGVGAAVGIGIISIIRIVFGIAMFVLAIIGIVGAAQGNEKPLPVIGGIRILK